MGIIADKVTKFLPFIKGRPEFDKKEALAIVPVRNPAIEWEWEGSSVVLHIPMRDDWLARMVKRMAKDLPETRKVALDEIASIVWDMCDENNTVNDIVKGIEKKTHLKKREAEVSVTTFLQTLQKRKYIGLLSAGGNESGNKRK